MRPIPVPYRHPGVGPGTAERPTVTVTDEDVRVLVRGLTIAKLVQLKRTRRWMIVIRGAVQQPPESWRNREEAIDAIKAMYANGVPE